MNITFLQNDMPSGRMFALDQQTLNSTAILLFNFCILALLLGFILYKPMQKYLRKRTERIHSQIDEAQAKTAQAEALKAEYEAKLAEIAAERAAILESAQLETAKQARQALNEARAGADVIKQQAEERILEEKERLKKELKQQVIEISSMMAEKLIQTAMDDKIHDRLFAEACAELEDTPWPN